MSISPRTFETPLLAAGIVFILLRSAAKDMPADGVVQMFVRPAGRHVQVLVPLPLASLLNLPKRGTDYLDLAHIAPGLQDAKATAASRTGLAGFSVHRYFEALAAQVTHVLRFVDGGKVRSFDLSGDAGIVRLDHRGYQAALTLVRAGCERTLSENDYQPFLFCLVNEELASRG